LYKCVSFPSEMACAFELHIVRCSDVGRPLANDAVRDAITENVYSNGCYLELRLFPRTLTVGPDPKIRIRPSLLPSRDIIM